MDLPITSITAAILAVMITAMSLGVSLRRQKLQVAVGHGDDHDLNRRIRAHANAIETVPLGLILLGLVEMADFIGLFVWLLAALLVLGRVAHAAGMYRFSTSLRATGMVMTHTGSLIAAVLLIWSCLLG
ncbi:MAPEG family protein [Brevundimonas sp.]|uniref:MAPEG family protein n=1 Tax=Brevundimonas sp. TaxID=1871086 RepID=UPI0025E148C5|nr:MAPEG family protein [Brevundimonas sp.]